MKLHYSPFFDGNSYLDYKTGNNLFGEKIVNDMGLLEELELRLGLSLLPVQGNGRIDTFRSVLDKLKRGKFYEKSFGINPSATSRNLLAFRDMLYMAGFDSSKTYKSQRLKDLCVIENTFTAHAFLGEPERWKRVLEALATNKLTGLKVEAYCHSSLVKPLIANVLDKLDVKFDDSKYNHSFTIDPTRVKVVPKQWQQQVYDFVASQSTNKGALIVCKDSFMFNCALKRLGKPEVKSTVKNTSPKILLLFKQIFNLCTGPISKNLLIDYLKQDLSPIPSMLRKNLLYALRRQAGFGEQWQAAKEKYAVTPNPFKPGESETERRSKLQVLAMIERVRNENDKVEKNLLLNYAKQVVCWCNGIVQVKADLSDEDKTLLRQLGGMCKQLEQMIGNYGGNELPDVALKNMVLEVYSGYTASQSHTEVGAIPVVEDLCNCIGVPNEIHWLDSSYCRFSDPYGQLLTKEREELGLVKSDILLKAYHDMALTNLNRIKGDIYLYLAKADDSGALKINSLVSELLFHTRKMNATAVVGAASGSVCPLTPKHYYEIGDTEIGTVYISPSKLENVYQSPFDFVCENTLRLPQSEEYSNELGPTAYGNVAHRVVELLVGKKNLSWNVQANQKDFENCFNQALRELGLEFLEDVNELLRYNFKNELYESLNSLVEVFKALGFDPVECEHTVSAPNFAKDGYFCGFGQVNASIDMIVKNSSGEYAIIDFKWTKKDKKYSDYLKFNTSVQLEMYKQLYETETKNAIGFVGYYIFPLGKFFVNEKYGFPKNGCLKLIKEDRLVVDLWKTLKESFMCRMEEIAKGHIEDGASLPVGVLDYQKMDNYPLMTENDKKANVEVKEQTYNYQILKNQLS